MLVARNSADKETAVVDRQTGAEEAPVAYLEVVESLGGALGVGAGRVRREAVASVDAVEVHHQSQFVQLTEPFQNWHEFVLETTSDAALTACNSDQY